MLSSHGVARLGGCAHRAFLVAWRRSMSMPSFQPSYREDESGPHIAPDDAVEKSVATPSPFHAGEQALQERLGVRASVERAGRRTIRNFLPEAHREALASFPVALLGSLDAHRRPWASILVGEPGFLRSPDEHTLVIGASPLEGDPAACHFTIGAPIGLLGMEPATRRRHRVGGTITSVDGGIAVAVEQSCGHCPKFIHAREPAPLTTATPARRPVRSWEGSRLSLRARLMIASADTFFIASTSPRAGMGDSTFSDGVDVSHRGGRPGFIRVGDDRGRTTLTSPDFIGNFMFNTLGNLALEPRAGILVVDYATGDLLSLTGEASVIWEGPELAAFKGAERLLQFHVDHGVLVPGGLPVRWSSAQPAPQLAETGTWEDVERFRSSATH
jgi:predicted pyridoxine 5'-phosphate oxidase superfamily flavin-nucleotide-binding protein